jgi:hypothetical protein
MVQMVQNFGDYIDEVNADVDFKTLKADINSFSYR